MKGTLLMSDGIDSPVAGYVMGRQGVGLAAVYFKASVEEGSSNDRKISEMKKRLESAIGAEIEAYSVTYLDTLTALKNRCKPNLTCVLCRRMMFRIGSMISAKADGSFLITGESLGQVASQTLTNMLVEEEASSLPVVRPLIGMDKVEIVNMAKTIGTFEISIAPSQPCEFAPDRPSTNSTLNEVISEEAELDVASLASRAYDGASRLV